MPGECPHGVERRLVDRLGQVEHLEALLDQPLDEGRAGRGGKRVRGDVEDPFLSRLHPRDVVVQGDQGNVVGVIIIVRVRGGRLRGSSAEGGGEAQQRGQGFLVGLVLDRAELDELAKGDQKAS